MLIRDLGHTGLRVSALGLGAGPLGDPALDEAAAERLIRGALDLGITLFDTAPSYGESEIRLGRALRGRRGEVVLSTKLGYGVPGIADWTGACITAGVDQALRRLATDHLDLAHLHSCGPEVLAREELLQALEAAVDAGKVRIAAYSGDHHGLQAARACSVFGAFQTSVNLVDQEALELPWNGSGWLGKRTLCNAAFCQREAPTRPDLREYGSRWRAIAPDLTPLLETEATPARDEAPTTVSALATLALRFAAFAGPHAVLVGTSRLEHLQEAVEALAQGPLPPASEAAIRGAWRRHRWPGMV